MTTASAPRALRQGVGDRRIIGQDKASADWLIASKNELSRTTEGLQPVELLVMTVSLSRLNEAATRLWRGDSDQVVQVVEEAVDLPNSLKLKVTYTTANAQAAGASRGMDSGSSVPIGRPQRHAASGKDDADGEIRHGHRPAEPSTSSTSPAFESPNEIRASASARSPRWRTSGDRERGPGACLPARPATPPWRDVEVVARRRLPKPTDQAWELEARRGWSNGSWSCSPPAATRPSSIRSGRPCGTPTPSALRSPSPMPTRRPPTERHPRHRGRRRARAHLGTDAEAVAPNEYSPIPLDLIDRAPRGARS